MEDGGGGLWGFPETKLQDAPRVWRCLEGPRIKEHSHPQDPYAGWFRDSGSGLSFPLLFEQHEFGELGGFGLPARRGR